MKTTKDILFLQSNKSTRRYLWAVVIPMLLLNAVVLIFSARNAKKEQQNHLNAVAERIRYEIDQSIDDAVSVSDYLCMDDALAEFLQKEYESRVDYYEEFNRLMNDNVIKYYYTAQSVYSITIVTDNSTITNGQYFVQKADVEKEAWYQDFLDSDRDMLVNFVYQDDNYNRFFNKERQVSVIRRMEAPLESCIMRLEVDFGELQSNIANVAGDIDFYIADDENILFTNQKQEAAEADFSDEKEYPSEMMEYSGVIPVIGNEWKLYLTDKNYGFITGNREWAWLWVVLLVLDVSIPLAVIILVNKNRQERQNLELSKTWAELNALQSQMNPHFMFNTLESIRMHCVLNDEEETEEMLGKFSLLLRQASQWETDFISMEKELKFVEDYLEIQKFRFRERLDYQLDVEEACKSGKVPKFGLLTFVENACVHGVEKCVGGGMIHVTVSVRDSRMCWEIRDTGSGMTEAELKNLREKIAHATMEELQKSSHIGILNIVIRLKLYYNQDVNVTVDSCEGQGTRILVDLPLSCEKEQME